MTRTIDRLVGPALLALSVAWHQGPAVADWIEIAAAVLPGADVIDAARPPRRP